MLKAQMLLGPGVCKGDAIETEEIEGGCRVRKSSAALRISCGIWWWCESEELLPQRCGCLMIFYKIFVGAVKPQRIAE